MAQKAQESSDSEVDALAKELKKAKVTPAGSTPQELVKLDP